MGLGLIRDLREFTGFGLGFEGFRFFLYLFGGHWGFRVWGLKPSKFNDSMTLDFYRLLWCWLSGKVSLFFGFEEDGVEAFMALNISLGPDT